MSIDPSSKDESFEEWAERVRERPSQEIYVLRLYITGMTARSERAIANLKSICETHLAGRYSLEVIDIRKHPQLAVGEQIIAAPTMVKALPEPMRKLVGDLSNEDRVLLGLDLHKKKDGHVADRKADDGSGF